MTTTQSDIRHTLPQAALALLAAAVLAGCNGGAEAPAAAPAQATPAASTTGVAAVGSADGRKGLLAGATVCLDRDGDGGCGATEPQATTGADGRYVLPADATAALLLEVPATATADGVAVGRAFTLRAPAGSTGISPLSTLVAAEMDSTGGSAEAAAERLRLRAGLAASPLAPLAEGDAARLAHVLAQLAAMQAEALAAVPAADARREIARVQAAALADIAAAARDGVGDDTLRAIAQRIGPDAAQVLLASRMFALAEPPTPAVPQASATLTALRYVDSDNWYLRTLESSADDNTPDADGWLRYVDVYAQSGSPAASIPKGVVQRWNGGGSPATAGNLHFNGSAWVTCGGLTARYRARPRDASGANSYDFCDGRESGDTVRRGEDISGQDMATVLRDKIRTVPGTASGLSFSQWGPANLSLLEGRTFPPGSYLFYHLQLPTQQAIVYDPRASNRVLVYPAGVTAGGDARSSPGIDCNNPTLTAASAALPATTLEELISRNSGRPCTYNRSGTLPDVSLDPDVAWSFSSVSLGTLPGFNTLPPGTGAFYNTTAALRVSFTAGGRARFHRCLVRASTGGSRECTLIGLGTWRIETMGDARVLSFSTLPAIVQRLGFTRVFVERGGAVYFASRNPVGVASPQVRLNLTAANALIEALPGMAPVHPIRRPGRATGADAAALATARGAWGLADEASATVFRFGADGRFFMAEAKPYEETLQGQSGAELGWMDHEAASGRTRTLLEVDSNLSSGTSHPRADDAPLSITDTAITSGDFSLPRLRDDRATDPTSLVGLWALDSLSDIGAPHLAFFANGRAMFVVQQADAACRGGTAPGQCPPGVEYASYTWDPVSGNVVLTLVEGETILPGGQRLLHYDTNGCQGLFETCAAAVSAGAEVRVRSFRFTLSSDGLSIDFLDAASVPRVLHRVPTRGLSGG